MLWLALVLGALAVLYAATMRRSYFFDADTANYLGLAESLLAGDGYRFDGRAHTKFPPGIPLVMLPVLAIAGRDFVALHLAVVALSMAALAAAFAWWRSRGEETPWLLLALTAGSATWYEYSTGASLSEVPYALATLLALVTAERASRAGGGSFARSVAFALLVAVAVVLRTSGVALLAAVAATALFRARRDGRDRRGLALALVVGALCLAAWSAWSAASRDPFFPDDPDGAATYAATYVDQLLLRDPHHPDLGRASAADLALRVLANFETQAGHVGEILTNAVWLPSRGVFPAAVAAVVLLAVGLRTELRRANPLAGWYALASLGLLLVWPFDEGRRFLMPLVPVLFTLALQGARVLLHGIARSPDPALRALALAGVALAALDVLAWRLAGKEPGTLDLLGLAAWLALGAGAGALLLAGASARARVVARLASPRAVAGAWIVLYAALGVPAFVAVATKNLERAGPLRQSPARDASDYLAANAPRDALVMATDWDAIHFVTGRETVPLPATRDPERLRRALRSAAPAFVVINAPREDEYLEPPDHARLEAILRAWPGALERVHRTDAVSIYRVVPERLEPPAASPAANVSRTFPIWISSPGVSARERTRLPFTRVPLVDWRSSSVQAPAASS